MKKVAICLISLVTFSCNSNSFREFEENLLFINNLKGNVKSLKSETFSAEEKFGEAIIGETIIPNDDLSDEILNLIQPNSTYEFTIDGKLKNRIVKSNYFAHSISIAYDKKGNKIESQLKTDKTESITRYSYDKNLINSSKTYDNNGELYRESYYHYEAGKLIEINSTDNEGNIVQKIRYLYDNELMTELLYDKSGTLILYYKKDIYGRFVDFLLYDDQKIVIKYANNNSQPSEILTYSGNDLIGKTSITLDVKQNIASIRAINEEGVTTTTYNYLYKYDGKGNWVERITYIDGVINYITIRTIEYFK